MKKIFTLLLFFFPLAGCVDLRAPTTHAVFQTISPKVQLASLAKITSFTMNGALSITLKNQPAEIANYAWTQTPTGYHISLSSALSLYRITIDKTGDVITLSKNGSLLTQAATPEALMQKAVGWSLPVNLLQYWIKGMPAPDLPYKATFNTTGQLTQLVQADFTIQYQAYQLTAEHLALPQLISMQNSLLFAKIVIKHFDTRAS